ncbi:MAG: HIRAN domain-containing protein [Pseudomonadota bacterium]
MKHLTLAVVGAEFPNKRGPTRRFAIELLRPGDPVQLIPEPKNPKDPRAIAVFDASGVQMGYLTAERAPLIGNSLRVGREIQAVFQGRAPFGCYIRVAFDGAAIDLPDVTQPESKAGGDTVVIRGEFDQREYDD